MPRTTGADLHIDVNLSQIAMAYRPTGFIIDQLAPTVPVAKQSDGFNIWSIADAYRVEDDRRAPGTEANVITRSVSSDTFYCRNYALKDRIPLEDIANADPGFSFLTARQDRAEFLKEKLTLNWEARVVDMVTSTSNVGSSTAVGSNWSDPVDGHSDPIGDLQTAIENVEGVTGITPNSIIFGATAWKYFRNHANVISRLFGYQTTERGRIANLNNVTALFEMERVLIGGLYYNSAQEGQGASLARKWADKVLVYYAPPTARKDTPSFMYSFRWNAVPGFDMQAEVFSLPRAKAEEVQVGYFQDEKITAKTLGFLITATESAV